MKNRRKLLKGRFYAVADEEMMTYVDFEEQKHASILEETGENQHKVDVIPEDFEKKVPQCIICSIVESISSKILGKNKHGRKYTRAKKA